MNWVMAKVCANVSSVSIGKRVYSDHVPVLMTWGCEGRKPRQFLWRLNTVYWQQRSTRGNLGKYKDFFIYKHWLSRQYYSLGVP